MRAIVTGALGFIGSHMVDLLLTRGFDVVAIDSLVTGRRDNLAHHNGHPRLAIEIVDVCTLPPDSPLFAGVDYVFHFAGIGDIVPSIDHPTLYMANNVQGTVAVLEASRHHSVGKFVYAASSSCYGLTKELPTTEAAPIQPEYPYALSKWMGECAVMHWGKVYRLPVVSIRMFNVYGPRSRTSGAYGAVFGVFLAQKLKEQPLTIVGDGSQTRDFVFATDVARAYLAAAESGVTGEIFNLGSGNPRSVNELARLIGGDCVHVPKRPGEPDCTWADISKIKAQLQWEPVMSFADGVSIMLSNISYWKDAPVWTPESIAEATRRWFECLGA